MKMDSQLATEHFDDEIDLYELWQTIWSQKWLILAITALTSVLAVIYALNATQTYQTEASLLPPNTAQIESIRLSELSGFDITRPTQESVYQTYIEKLTSSEAITHLLNLESHNIFLKNDLQLSDTQAYSYLNKNLIITPPSESKQNLVFQSLDTNIAFQASDPIMSFDILNDFLRVSAELTNQEIRYNLLSSIESNLNRLEIEYTQENARVNREIEAEIMRLEEADLEKKETLLQKIALLKDKAKLDREYRIIRLKNDFNIAQALGIETPVNPSEYNRQANNVSRVDINSQNPSRYWLGTKALGQEILTLESRHSDDAFISELPDLLRQLEALKVNQRIERLKNRKDNFPFSDSLRELNTKMAKLKQAKAKIEQADFSTYKISQAPMIPESPIKPNKKLIVAVAFVLGGMLGVFIALIRGAVRKRQQTLNAV